jgi:endoglucanase Acf2
VPPHSLRWVVAFAFMAGAAVLGCAASIPPPTAAIPPEARQRVGAGGYVTVLPPGEKAPSNFRGEAVQPKVVEGFVGVPATNDWWSSLIWQFDRGGKANPFSEPLFAHPLALQAQAAGLGVGYPREPVVDKRAFFYPYTQDLRVGVEGLDAPETRVVSSGDWSVTMRWQGRTANAPALVTTIGHGLPFVYAEAIGGKPLVVLAERQGARVFAERAGVVGLEINGHVFALFAGQGGRWVRGKDGFVVEGGGGFFSVAVLPDDRPATLARFRRHALAFVTDTRVSWRYDAPSSSVVTSYEVTTDAKEPGATVPLLALYPHQWKHASGTAAEPAYVSPRGPMRLLEAARFETRTPFRGILPVLPALAGGTLDPAELGRLVASAARAEELFPAGLENTKGTYWIGKSLGRVALLAWLAEEAGQGDSRQRLVAALERQLEDWLDGQAPNYFYYDRTWHTLYGVPAEYRSGWELNDHHFHFAYYILAAATVARFDPAWARPERWGGMIDLLLRDAANADRADRRFPFLRHFDAYAGHSWANGPALFAEGNNEESSSEDVNFAVATFLWGALTGDRASRDLGLFLYANVTAAVDEYWFDVDRTNFPAGFTRAAVGMVWGSGGKYDTWWDRNPIYVHGINFLPFTGGSLYLGHHPAYVRRNLDALIEANHGEPMIWRDIIWMYRALEDPQAALTLYDRGARFDPEFGDSQAFVYHWLHGLADLGWVDTTVTADAPTYAVFSKGGVRQHVAWNPGGSPTRMTFSDGVTVDVPAYGMVVGR